MTTSRKSPTGQRLRQERERRNWSQQMLADKLGTSVLNINRWEHNKTLPQPYYREKLCKVFAMSTEELFGQGQQEEMARPPVANIPYLRNLYFTGREEVLAALRSALVEPHHMMALSQRQALSGLGGVGKTQIAVEYAYRYADTYEALFWVRADSSDLLISDFLAIAAMLHLPQRNQQDQHEIIQAVKRWFATHDRWLLIFDNADRLELVHDFLPTSGKGHVILTTRAQATGTLAHHIDIDKMSQEEGALFLLRRMKRLKGEAAFESVSKTTRALAQEIAEAMGGLPLALDQAGAYIEETGCSLADYLQFYQTHRERLLRLRGRDAAGHPEPVAMTWSLSFAQVKQTNPASAEILHLCAFLHPDAIPEMLFVATAPELGPVLGPVARDRMNLNDAIREILAYSLVRRDPERKYLHIHRLVQTMIKDGMEEEVQRRWAERVVRAMYRAFPEGEEMSVWATCQQYLSHALVAASLIHQYGLRFLEAVQLLDRVGNYLTLRAQFREAEALYQQALDLHKQIVGENHPDVRSHLNNLANLYTIQGRYEQAYALYQQTLAPYEQETAASVERARTIYGLACLYHDQGLFQQAEPLYRQALTMRQQMLGAEHPDVADTLNRLAWLYHDQGRLQEVEPLYQQALAVLERSLGPHHPRVAESLTNLALLYWDQSKYEQAYQLYQRALLINKQTMGEEHPGVALALNNLALLYWKQGHYEQAEPLYQQALAIWEKALGPDHSDVATCLNNLGRLYQDQGRYHEAESFHRRALAIRERELGVDHPDVAFSLNNLALLYQSRGKYEEAEAFFQRTLTLRERVLGSEHLLVATTLANFASLYCDRGKYEEAELLYQRALLIQKSVLAAEHPDLTRTLKNYTTLLQKMGKMP